MRRRDREIHLRTLGACTTLARQLGQSLRALLVFEGILHLQK